MGISVINEQIVGTKATPHRISPRVRGKSVQLEQPRLDITDKSRSSRLPWRGQFSPELIEYFLDSFAHSGATVLDPFCGSGTVLFECLEKGFHSVGADVNPAAFLLSSAVRFASIGLKERTALIETARQGANRLYNGGTVGDLFWSGQSEVTEIAATRRLIQETGHDADQHLIVALSLMLGMGDNRAPSLAAFEKGLRQVEDLLNTLPASQEMVETLLTDARSLPLQEESVDLAITSPPYINVFNYHQNYRPALELLGWQPLKAAPSEIGANRKHRQNRFLTVVQYCIDMQLAFTEVSRVLRPGGRIVLIVGRSSSVLGTSFYNGDLLEAVLKNGVGFSIEDRRHRVFLNRFGERIYEEIIVADRPSHQHTEASIVGQSIGIAALEAALDTAPKESKILILEALQKAKEVAASPKLDISVPNRVAYLETKESSPIEAGPQTGGGSSVKVARSNAHGDKLVALLINEKLHDSDRVRVEEAVKRHKAWVTALDVVKGTADEILTQFVQLLAEYKRFIELELIYDSENDFLYRQKGQLKLDNTILEEFLPRLFDERLIPGFARLRNMTCGPRASFAGLTFDSPFMALSAGGAYVKLKDQDFSVNKGHRISITENPPTEDCFTMDVSISYFATEIKTNLDKTMFQEAAQTAGELKRAVSGCKYILLCEYLDMTPINTKLTPIDEVIVLRKGKRLSSNIREQFSTAKGRQAYRAKFVEFLDHYPLRKECFGRFIDHLNECFPTAEADKEDAVLGRGYF